jgi:hypothetical protein
MEDKKKTASVEDILGERYYDEYPIQPKAAKPKPAPKPKPTPKPAPPTKKPAEPKKAGSKPKPRVFAKPLTIPSELKKTPTVSAIARGNYQNKVKTHYSTLMLVELMESIRTGLINGDAGAMKLASEIYAMTPGKGNGISVNVQQNNANQGGSAVAVAADAGKPKFRSPDEMFRQLAAEKEQRALSVGPMEFTILPDAVEKPQPLIDTRNDEHVA